MDSFKPTLDELGFCMKDPRCIRNVCILAHVDHGKTTLADLLLTTNKLVSKRHAGFMRYLDDRQDEQERGITMKSSAVSLLNVLYDDELEKNRTLLFNLIDTPGHIDFSSEVGAAVRVCDGAIILVDIVEGVCVQTRESISKAFEEHAKIILVINKFDRLVVELEKSSDDIFQSILRIIEDCNAIIAELYQFEFADSEVDIEDTGFLFSPESGNIIFASAIDGWGFTTKQIAKMYVNFVKNETVDSLNTKLWNFDLYMDAKREIKSGAIDKQKPNLFTQLCIKTIEFVYQTIIIRRDKEKIPSLLEKLGIKSPTRDMTHHNDSKVQIRAIMSGWKSLANTILLQCLRIMPSPGAMEKRKVNYLLNVNKYMEDQYLNSCLSEVIPYFQNIQNTDDTATIAYVSKMFCVNKTSLSQHAPKQFIPKPRNAEETETLKQQTGQESNKKIELEEPQLDFTDEVEVIALARVFTGCLKVGQELYCLSSNYAPNEQQILSDLEGFVLKNPRCSKVIIKELYMLFGKELSLVGSIPAGNICGIGGLGANILRTATLSTKIQMVPLVEHPCLPPVVRHAVEPVNPKELPILRKGLKLLMQSDSCVQVIMQESGELVVLTAGDVHLEKCIQDLTKKFTNIEVHVSSPMVALRETVTTRINDNCELISLKTNNIEVSMIVVQLPSAVVKELRNFQQLLTMVEEHHNCSLIDLIKQFNLVSLEEDKPSNHKTKIFISEGTNRALIHTKSRLKQAFNSCGPLWAGFDEKIWSVGKIVDCESLLINDTKDFVQNIFLETNIQDKRTFFSNCIVNQFHKFCKAGPLCEEPLTNCAFIVKNFELVRDIKPEDITPQLVSLEEAAIKGAMKTCFEKQEQRLMEPIYTTSIQVNTSILGKVYTVISKRHGKVLDAVGMDEKEKSFLVQAQIPVIESEGFAMEIRSTTSGQANPSLRFSHYEIIDGDPFYEIIEEDVEDEDMPRIEAAMRATKLRKEVRRRKGLHVEDEVVVHAEKQRTLNKKK